MMNSLKINYLNNYKHLIDMAGNPYSITTQVKHVILGTDPSKGDTLLQGIIARDLEMLHLDSFNDIIKFNQSYITLVANTGRTFSEPELTKNGLAN